MNELLIYDRFGQGGITAKGVSEELKNFGGDDVVVRINSPGGSVFEGLAVYNLLKEYPGKKTVKVDGVALSMASGVAMAGDEIQAASNSLMMLHNPMASARGNAKDIGRTMKMLESSKDALVVAYAERSKRSNDVIEAMLDDETWLTAKEAKAVGFVDTITGEQSVSASFEMPTEYNVPANMVGKLSTFFVSETISEESDVMAETKPDVKDTGPQPATLNELLALKGSDNDFAVEQMKAGATLVQAQNALCAVLIERAEKAEAEKVEAENKAQEATNESQRRQGEEPGHDAINNDGDDESEAAPEALQDQFDELLANEVKKIGDPTRAYRNVNRKHPGLIKQLRDEATAAYNEEGA